MAGSDHPRRTNRPPAAESELARITLFDSPSEVDPHCEREKDIVTKSDKPNPFKRSIRRGIRRTRGLEDAAPIPNSEYQIREGASAVYRAIFDVNHPDRVVELRKRLETYEGDIESAEAAIDYISSFNGGRFPFGLNQLLTLKDLFLSRKPLCPAPLSPAPLNALSLWAQMVVGPIDDVVQLMERVHDYQDARGAEPARTRLIEWIERWTKFDPEATPDDKDRTLDHLVLIAADLHTPFQDLRWWEAWQDMW